MPDQLSVYAIKFFAGPRDGDVAFQVMEPPEHYFIEIDKIVPFGETVEGTEVVPATSHHYELNKKGTRQVVYIYRGVLEST